MSERMDRIREFAEQARQYDVDLGRKLERDRILGLLENYYDNETWYWNDLLRKIKGEN